MASHNLRRKLTRALGTLGATTDPLRALDAAREVREVAEALEAAHVAAARESGSTWTEIGARYGLTKQGTQQRFGRNSGRPPKRASK